jgi:hypothetical protein
MARLWCLRIAGAGGVVPVALVLVFGLFLALFLVSLDPFLSAAPIAGGGAGAAVGSATPAVSVNRSLKGDRLPLFNSGLSSSTGAKPAVWPGELRAPNRSQPRGHVPLGCDPAFSPVSSPSPANVYGRCMV